jgi:hypothetical protein
MYEVTQVIICEIILKYILLYMCSEVSICEVLYVNIQISYLEGYEPNS